MKRILVIDDEDGVRNLIADVLRNEGYYVDDFAEGLKLYDYLTEIIPDLIWLDLMLIDTTGPLLLAYLTKEFPSIKVICITAYTTNELIDSAAKLGAYKFLSKPFHNIEDIVSVTEEALCQPG